MSYIGTPPSNAFTSLLKQDFSTSATTGYTLDHAVNNANDIALFINFVRQEPTAGYAASGTSLVLTSATASSDDMYCVYLGQALQTVNPANASVGSSQLSPTAITGQTALTSVASDDTVLISDTSASGALKKMTRANFVSGIGGTNTPAFSATLAGTQSVSDNATTQVAFAAEIFDVGSCYNNTGSAVTLNGISVPAYSFLPNVAGKYAVSAMLTLYAGNYSAYEYGIVFLRKNTTDIAVANMDLRNGSNGRWFAAHASTAYEMNGTSDYFTVYGVVGTSSSPLFYGDSHFSTFQAHKIIE